MGLHLNPNLRAIPSAFNCLVPPLKGAAFSFASAGVMAIFLVPTAVIDTIITASNPLMAEHNKRVWLDMFCVEVVEIEVEGVPVPFYAGDPRVWVLVQDAINDGKIGLFKPCATRNFPNRS